VLVFQGSANETNYAMDENYNAESISVYLSWDEEIFKSYRPFIEGFEELWEGRQINTLTVDVPSSIYDKISSKFPVIDNNPNVDIEDSFVNQGEIDFGESYPVNIPQAPLTIGDKEFKIFKHQREALEHWKANSYKGILKLATGSGKTITAIYGLTRIYQAKNRLFVIISVPYIGLANQWVTNLSSFNIFPIKCYDSKIKWYEKLRNTVNAFNIGSIDFHCAVVVNKTLTSDDFQKLVSKVIPGDLLFIGDECHCSGAKKVSQSLPNADLRLGLSATPFRSDEDEFDSPFPNEAKGRITDYYGKIVAEYTLEDAIFDGVLTPYDYHIIDIHLTSDEQLKYEELSEKISKLIIKQMSSHLDKKEREILTQLCGVRSRLLGSAENKLIALGERVKSVPKDRRYHTLIYCGEGAIETEEDGKVSQIDLVTQSLRTSGWRSSKFTSYETKKERNEIMGSFLANNIDALVAMKVLDEGIDVPACDTAYIMASTKNPRQYIQRRGRILRRYEGKKKATIFDFVVLPEIGSNNKYSMRLIESEKERVHEFTMLASNKSEIIRKMIEIGFEDDG